MGDGGGGAIGRVGGGSKWGDLGWWGGARASVTSPCPPSGVRARARVGVRVRVRVMGRVRCRVRSRLRVGVGVRVKVGFKRWGAPPPGRGGMLRWQGE